MRLKMIARREAANVLSHKGKCGVLLVASLSALSLAGPALAADLPSRQQFIEVINPAPVISWGGFYAGVNVGGHWTNGNDVNITSPATDPRSNPWILLSNTANVPSSSRSLMGGGQVGYNFTQFSPLVIGIEGDIQGFTGSQSGSARTAYQDLAYTRAHYTDVGTMTAHGQIDYLGTLRGRVGYLATPTLMAYATGGLAFGRTDLYTNAMTSRLRADGSTIIAAGASAKDSDTRAGWTVGAGLEWKFMPNLSAKVEYLYYNLGVATSTASYVNTAGNAPNTYGMGGYLRSRTRLDGQIARVGLNYQFITDQAPPVVAAKY